MTTTSDASTIAENDRTLLLLSSSSDHPTMTETTPRTNNGTTSMSTATTTTTAVARPTVRDTSGSATTTSHRTTGPATSKRRHSVAITTSWEDVARRGSRLKSFFTDATSDMIELTIKRLKTQDGAEQDNDSVDKENASTATSTATTAGTTTATNDGTAVTNGIVHLNKLVEDNYVENMQLRRKLDNAETERAALEAAQKSLRDEVNYWKDRHGRTAEALRISDKNAAHARHDADLAETTAAHLAQTLQSLQAVVAETKLAGRQLAEEQQLVDQKAAAIERKYLTQKQELMRITKDAQQLRQSNALLDHARDRWKHERKNMEQQVKVLQNAIATLRREASDQAAVEASRQERAKQDQADLHEAQQLLAQATDQQEMNSRVQTTLQDTVKTLEAANADLHEKIMEQQSNARTDVERLSTALSKAEREAQKHRLDKEAMEDELKRIKQYKDAAAKQIQELKSRVIAAERLVNSSNTGNHQEDLPLTTPKSTTGGTASSHSDDTTISDNHSSNKIVFRLPPLPGSAKDKQSTTTTSAMINHADVTAGKSCCICFKSSFGIMKACQCGTCQERAHMTCVRQVTTTPSVSHPGTPASPIPVVLCKLRHRRFGTTASAAVTAGSHSDNDNN